MDIITFCLFLFTSFSKKSFFILLFATYSVNVNFRDYSGEVTTESQEKPFIFSVTVLRQLTSL